ncbi:MAG TPA: serine hydrolase domain-containing protein [Cyclobacteriaceae bacterium]|jgi:beta-lactamase class C|nr:serine hydrolase domain-containing protein [Cyclobacteriaceae bacterium]
MKIALWVVVVGIAVLAFFGLSKSRSEIVAKPLVRHDSVRIEKQPFIYHDPNPFVESAIKEYEGFVKTLIANRQAPGAALVILRDTSIVFVKGYGLREIGKLDSVNSKTVFRIGSVSKSMSATLCAALVNDGVLQWDDPVIKYLPSFKLKTEEATKNVTIRHILSHTEGLPYHAYTDMLDRGAPVDTLIDYLQDLNLVAAPGKIFSYQNVGFSLIGKVIEAATKKSFEEVLTEKLFRPLEMKNASASFKKISENKNVAKPHYLTRSLKISDAYYSVAPAGGINASAEDMGLWLKEILTQKSKVFNAGRLKEIFEPQIHAPVRNYNFFKWKRIYKSYYGLGWRVVTFADSDTLIYHGGFVNNYRCEVAVNPKTKIAIALLVNSSSFLADRGVAEFFKIYDRHLTEINNWKPTPLP